MNKTRLIDIPSPSLVTVSNSADGDLNEDDIFAIDISQAPPRNSPVSSPLQHHHHPARQLQRSKSNLKNVETSSGILAALPESSGNNSYSSHVFHHKPAVTLSTSVSSTASSLSPSGGGPLASSSSSARVIPSAPKPSQERLSYIGGGKFPQSAPVQVPLMSSKMMNRHKKEFKLTDVVDEEEEDEDGEMVPPHEIVARSLAQSSMLSCSVLEGAGRTLKGRDLRQVRNAVLRRTGFID